MLKSYRKRFVLLNTLFVGAVLLIAFVAQGVYSYQRSYSEMVNTMRLVVAPWDEPGPRFREPEERPPEDLGADAEMPELPARREGERAEGIITVFYDSRNDSLSVLSDDTSLDDSDIAEAVKEISGLSEGFGRLDAYGLFYYREDGFTGSKIAIADLSYLYSRLLQNTLVLLVAETAVLVAMALLWLAAGCGRRLDRPRWRAASSQ